MPKWKNKGHEFDELGNYFKEHNEIVILGQDISDLSRIERKLEFLSKEGVKVRCERFNYLTYKLSQLFGKSLFGKNIIILIPEEDQRIMRRMSRISTFDTTKNLFSENRFFEKILPIFAVYVKDLVYFKDNSFLCTSVCNLNCEFCLNFTPYDKNKRHFSLEELKKNVDIFFNAVDMCGLFHISGGKPFLYPHLNELINYIFDNYKNKIFEIGLPTNGTIIPSDELLKTIKRCNVRMEIDDYTKAIPKLKNSFEKLKEKFKEFDITPVIHVTDQFIEMFPPRTKYGELGENALCCHYSECGASFRELINGKLSNCNYSSFATRAGLIEYNSDDYFDLNKFKPEMKTELVEFRLGYCAKGYSEFCKYCEGLPSINKYKSAGGKQIQGQLDLKKD